MTHEKVIALDRYDSNTMHVYTRTYSAGRTYLALDYSLQVDDLHAHWGLAGEAIQHDIANDLHDYTHLTLVRLSVEVQHERRTSGAA